MPYEDIYRDRLLPISELAIADGICYTRCPMGCPPVVVGGEAGAGPGGDTWGPGVATKRPFGSTRSVDESAGLSSCIAGEKNPKDRLCGTRRMPKAHRCL